MHNKFKIGRSLDLSAYALGIAYNIDLAGKAKHSMTNCWTENVFLTKSRVSSVSLPRLPSKTCNLRCKPIPSEEHYLSISTVCQCTTWNVDFVGVPGLKHGCQNPRWFWTRLHIQLWCAVLQLTDTRNLQNVCYVLLKANTHSDQCIPDAHWHLPLMEGLWAVCSAAWHRVVLYGHIKKAEAADKQLDVQNWVWVQHSVNTT